MYLHRAPENTRDWFVEVPTNQNKYLLCDLIDLLVPGGKRFQKMKILFIGDIVGKAGRQAIEELLEKVISDYDADFTIANGENAAGGMGITPAIALEILSQGVDVLTSGNHIWAKKEILPFLGEESRILRPANYPAGVPGRGAGLFKLNDGQKIGILNLEGRVS
jgi:calcineurin-like phosphoesterase